MDCKRKKGEQDEDYNTYRAKSFARSKKKRRKSKHKKSKKKAKGAIPLQKSTSCVITKPSFDMPLFDKRTTEITLEWKDIGFSLQPIPDLKSLNGNEFHLQLFEEASKNIEELWEMMEAEEVWKLSKDKKNIQLYKLRGKLEPSEWFIKRVIEIDAPISKVMYLFRDHEFQLQCNSRLRSLDLLEKISDEASITHQISKSFFIMNAREFYTFANLYQLSDRMYLLSNHTIEHEDFPNVNKIVRGKVKGIFVFEELDSNCTRVTNVLNINLKGRIPHFISNKMADAQYDSFALLKQRIEEHTHSVGD